MVSVKSKYGVSVVLFLAINKGHALYTIKALSESCSVPKKYLEQLLNALRKAGIVSSVRGKMGGYQLAKLPSSITVYDIVSCLEHSILFSEGYAGGVSLDNFWKSIDLMFKSSLNVTFEELVSEYNKTQQCLSFAI